MLKNVTKVVSTQVAERLLMYHNSCLSLYPSVLIAWSIFLSVPFSDCTTSDNLHPLRQVRQNNCNTVHSPGCNSHLEWRISYSGESVTPNMAQSISVISHTSRPAALLVCRGLCHPGCVGSGIAWMTYVLNAWGVCKVMLIIPQRTCVHIL